MRAPGAGAALLRVENLSVDFSTLRRRIGGARRVVAVEGVSFELQPGETLALVGESGSGKSTVARALLRTIRASSGQIYLGNDLVSGLSERRFRPYRRNIQMVFQDPLSSLDPSMTIGDTLAEPLLVFASELNGQQRRARVAETLDLVGLSPEVVERHPYEFSGGQRQRISIARALMLRPKVIVCDEPVSSLDSSTRNQIINLLCNLQRQLDLSLLFISHDLAISRHIAQRAMVMYLGEIVESGPIDRVFDAPAHPYTRALIASVPVPDPSHKGTHRPAVKGDLPSLHDIPSGCRFHTRCPFVMDVCRIAAPEMMPVTGGGQAACHLLGDQIEGDGPDA